MFTKIEHKLYLIPIIGTILWFSTVAAVVAKTEKIKHPPVVPSCFAPAALLSAADSYGMAIEQFGPEDIHLVEIADRTGFILANIGDAELLVVVHPLPGSNNAILFSFTGGCFDSVAEMPDDRFRTLMERTKS